MDKQTISPQEAKLNRLATTAQSRLYSMDGGAFATGCNFSLRDRARYIQTTSLDLIALLQQLREVAIAILNGAPATSAESPTPPQEEHSPVRCADCHYQVSHSWDQRIVTCTAHLTMESKDIPRQCTEYRPRTERK